MARDTLSGKNGNYQLPPGMMFTIQQTLKRIAASLDLKEILEVITANARQLVGAEIAQVNLYDPEADRAWVGARDDGRPERPEVSPTPPRPEGLTMQIVREGNPIVVEDVREHPLFAGYKPAKRWGIKTWAGFPIRRRESVVGVLMVAFVRCHQLSQLEQHALELLAGQAAVAIENARLFQAEQRQRILAETLREVAEIVSSSLQLDEVLGRVLDQLGRVVTYDSASIFLVQEDGHHLQAVSSRGLPTDTVHPPRVTAIENDAIFRVLKETRAPLVLKDAQRDPRWISHPKLDYIHGWIGVPLIAKDRVVGMLTLDSKQVDAYGPQETEVADLFARHAAIAIENARLFEAERERRLIAEAFSQTAATLTSTLDLETVLDLVLESLRSVVDYDSCAIFLRQHDRLVFTAGQGFSSAVQIADFSFNIAESALEPILTEEGQPMIIPDVQESENFKRAEGHDIVRSWIGAPLWARDKLVGLMTVDHSEPGRYSERDASRVMDFANQAAIVIENARLHAAIQVHAEELELRVMERTAELRHEKDKTEAILNSVADGVVVADLNGKIQMANPVARRWLREVNGYKRPSQPLRRFIARLAKTSPSGSVHRTEFSTGYSRVTLEAHAAWLQEQGTAQGIVVVLRDVTRQQELERLKSQFIASVSHELRTPLANIKLYLALLQKGKQEKRPRYLHVAAEEADRLEQLIQDLLDFSQLDAPSGRIAFEPVRLNAIVRDTVQDYKARAENAGLILNVYLDSSVPVVLGDRQQLSRMLTKLLDNALSYTSAGDHITLTLKSLKVEGGFCKQVLGPGIDRERGLQVPAGPDGEWVGLIVSDTGVGIPPKDLPHIFDRFYRGGHAETMRLPGTGLGLSHVRNILRRHKGHVVASSVVDEGSTFVILIPGHSAEA